MINFFLRLFCLSLLALTCVNYGRFVPMVGAGGMTYETELMCRETCIGDHDLGCVRMYANRWMCRCQSSYYNNPEVCYEDCGYNSYWNILIYGECVQTPTQYGGACQTYCVHRPQGWTIFFIVVIFISAVILLILIIPIAVWVKGVHSTIRKWNRASTMPNPIMAVTPANKVAAAQS